MAVLTGSTTMYEQVLDCMGWQWCPDFGDCRPVVSKDLGFSDFGFATMIKFCWSCWFVDNQTCGRLRGRWYCSVLMAACSAFVDTCLSLSYFSVLNFCVWMLGGIDAMVVLFAYLCGMCQVISTVLLLVVSSVWTIFRFSFGFSVGCVHGPHSYVCGLCTYL
ncbi:hypothetical protein CsSME_00031436 [Camellia sinensis var. sinensis]